MIAVVLVAATPVHAFRVIGNTSNINVIRDGTHAPTRVVERVIQIECDEGDFGQPHDFRFTSATGSPYTLRFVCGALTRTYSAVVAGYVPRVGGVREYRQCLARNIGGSRPEDPTGILKSQGVTPTAFAASTGTTPRHLAALHAHKRWRGGKMPLVAQHSIYRRLNYLSAASSEMMKRHAQLLSVARARGRGRLNLMATSVGDGVDDPKFDKNGNYIPKPGEEFTPQGPARAAGAGALTLQDLTDNVAAIEAAAKAAEYANGNVTATLLAVSKALLTIAGNITEALKELDAVQAAQAAQSNITAQAVLFAQSLQMKTTNDIEAYTLALGNRTNQLGRDLAAIATTFSADEQNFMWTLSNVSANTTDVMNRIVDVMNERILVLQRALAQAGLQAQTIGGVAEAAVNGDDILDALTTHVLADPYFDGEADPDDPLMPFTISSGVQPALEEFAYVDESGTKYPGGVAMYTVVWNVLRFLDGTSSRPVARRYDIIMRCNVRYMLSPSSGTGSLSDILHHMSTDTCEPTSLATSGGCYCWFEVRASSCPVAGLEGAQRTERMDFFLDGSTLDHIDPSVCASGSSVTSHTTEYFTSGDLFAGIRSICSTGLATGTTYRVTNAFPNANSTTTPSGAAPTGCVVNLETMLSPEGEPTFVLLMFQNAAAGFQRARATLRSVKSTILGVLPSGLHYTDSAFGVTDNDSKIPARCATASFAVVSRDPDEWLPVRLYTLQSETAVLHTQHIDGVTGAITDLPDVTDIQPQTAGAVPPTSFVAIGELDSRATEVVAAPFSMVSIAPGASARRGSLTYAMVPAGAGARDAARWSSAWQSSFDPSEYIPVDFGTDGTGFVVPLYGGDNGNVAHRTCDYATASHPLAGSSVVQAYDFNSPCSLLETNILTLSPASATNPDASRTLTVTSVSSQTLYVASVRVPEGSVEDVFTSVCPTYTVAFVGTSIARVTIRGPNPTDPSPDSIYVVRTGCVTSTVSVTLPGNGGIYTFDQGPCTPVAGGPSDTFVSVYVDSVDTNGALAQLLCPTPLNVTVDRTAAVYDNGEADKEYVEVTNHVVYSSLSNLAAGFAQDNALLSAELARIVLVESARTGTLYPDDGDALRKVISDALNITKAGEDADKAFELLYQQDELNLTLFLAAFNADFKNRSAEILTELDAIKAKADGIKSEIADAESWLDLAQNLEENATAAQAAADAAQTKFFENSNLMIEGMADNIADISAEADPIIRGKAMTAMFGPFAAILNHLKDVKDCRNAVDETPDIPPDAVEGIISLCEWLHDAQVNADGERKAHRYYIAFIVVASFAGFTASIVLAFWLYEWYKGRAVAVAAKSVLPA